MTTKAKAAEADRATQAFHLVLTSIGVETVTDALVHWEEVPQSNRPEQVAAWMDKAVSLVMSRRTLAGQVALAWYRLIRALRTGSTIADPNTPEPKSVSLQKLRSEFDALARPRLADRYKEHLLPQHQATTPRKANQGDGGGLSDDEADRILVEEIEGLAKKEAADAEAAEQDLRNAIEELGLRNKKRLLDQIDTRQSADVVDKQRNAAHDKAGVRQAAAGERVAMNGGRSTAWNLKEGDRKAIGWIRVSQTGTPCGWCAMLISRGVVYKSKAAAEYVDGDKYHDNCHCIAVPVFSDEEYETNDQYALNRKYQKLWPQVTRGYSGKAAMTVWRRYIRQHPEVANAQAVTAKTPTTAQEA